MHMNQNHTGILTEQDEILNRLKGMKISDLKQEILRLEIENKELKQTLKSESLRGVWDDIQ